MDDFTASAVFPSAECARVVVVEIWEQWETIDTSNLLALVGRGRVAKRRGIEGGSIGDLEGQFPCPALGSGRVRKPSMGEQIRSGGSELLYLIQRRIEGAIKEKPVL